MSAVVCTLFEGHYHYGVAGLVNSLYKNGFRGTVYAGYKGQLPYWATNLQSAYLLHVNASVMQIAEGLNIVFIPLETEYHLTNYKPNFMLDVWGALEQQTEHMVYFDPDIVVKCKWSFFEEWMSYGVALVHEIIANDMSPHHPIRSKWEKVIIQSNKEVKRNLTSYINGGFIGLHKNYKEYLETVLVIMQTAFTYFHLTPGQFKHNYDRTYEFFAQDQDAINIAAMCCESPICDMGPEAMDFVYGGFTMSHAVGSPKPWRKKFLLSFLQGNPPTLTDKEYWKAANGIIKPYSNLLVTYKIFSIKLASFFGRFYRKY